MSPDEERKMLGNLQILAREAKQDHAKALEEMTQYGEQLRDLGLAILAYSDTFKTSWEVTGASFGVTTADKGLVRVEPYPTLKDLLVKRDGLWELRKRAEGLAARVAMQS